MITIVARIGRSPTSEKLLLKEIPSLGKNPNASRF
jgi:hypothetical protein